MPRDSAATFFPALQRKRGPQIVKPLPPLTPDQQELALLLIARMIVNFGEAYDNRN